MPVSPSRLHLFVPFVLGCIACAGAPTERQDAALPERFAGMELPPVPASEAALVGFDALEPDFAIRQGDTSLYRMLSTSGDESEAYTLSFEVLGTQVNSGPMAVSVTSADGSLERIKLSREVAYLKVKVVSHRDDRIDEAELGIPTDALRLTPFDLFDSVGPLESGGPGTFAVREERRSDGHIATVSVLMLLNAWQEHSALRPLLEHVVGRPSLLATIRFAAARSYLVSFPTLEPSPRRFRLAGDGTWGPLGPTDPPGAGVMELDGYTCHLEMSVGGEVLMDLELDVVDSVAPLSGAAGILEIRGVNRNDPNRRLRLQLVGARTR